MLNQDSPTWFFFNKKFDVKVEKFKSFSFYKKPKKNSSFTIDTPKDLLRIKKFLKKNQCLPEKTITSITVENFK